MRMFILLVAALISCAEATCPKMTIRKDARIMTPYEWKDFTDTIELAQRTPDPDNPNQSIWEAGSNLHSLLGSSMYGTCQTWYWHRGFLAHMERKLQKLNPHFFFPYFDSSLVWDNATASVVFKYLGRSGVPVKNATLAGIAIQPDNNPLIRDFRWEDGLPVMPSSEQFAKIFESSLDNGGFSYYSARLEALHNVFRVYVGGPRGHLSRMSSPADPLFYLHYAFADKTFLEAQAGWTKKNSSSTFQIGLWDANGKACALGDKLFGFHTRIVDALDPKNLCVEYDVTDQAIQQAKSPLLLGILQNSRNTNDASLRANSVDKLPFEFNVKMADLERRQMYTGTQGSNWNPRGSNWNSQGSNWNSQGSNWNSQGSNWNSQGSNGNSQGSNWNSQGSNGNHNSDSSWNNQHSGGHNYPSKERILVTQYVHPADYKQISVCHDPLPSNWISINSGLNDRFNLQVSNELNQLCLVVLQDLRNGVAPPQRPIILNPWNRQTINDVVSGNGVTLTQLGAVDLQLDQQFLARVRTQVPRTYSGPVWFTTQSRRSSTTTATTTTTIPTRTIRITAITTTTKTTMIATTTRQSPTPTVRPHPSLEDDATGLPVGAAIGLSGQSGVIAKQANMNSQSSSNTNPDNNDTKNQAPNLIVNSQTSSSFTTKFGQTSVVTLSVILTAICLRIFI